MRGWHYNAATHSASEAWTPAASSTGLLISDVGNVLFHIVLNIYIFSSQYCILFKNILYTCTTGYHSTSYHTARPSTHVPLDACGQGVNVVLQLPLQKMFLFKLVHFSQFVNITKLTNCIICVYYLIPDDYWLNDWGLLIYYNLYNNTTMQQVTSTTSTYYKCQ